MKIGDIRRIIAERRNESDELKAVCRQIAPVDEGFIYHVAGDILNRNRERNIIQNIDDVLHEQYKDKRSTAEPLYTIYPFGDSAGIAYPRFLAVCRAGETLNNTFAEISKQSKKMAKLYGKDCNFDKTVILLTDKWDFKTFKKYEKEFLNYALHDGIWYIFLLVTEYGCTQIPFLPNDRTALRNIPYAEVEDDITFEDMLRRLEGQPFEYSFDGGTWTANEIVYYFDAFSWHKESVAEKCAGKIPCDALRDFLEKIFWIADIPEEEIILVSRAVDAPVSTLHIFGKTVEWDDVSVGTEKHVNKLAKIVKNFIKKCEENSTVLM